MNVDETLSATSSRTDLEADELPVPRLRVLWSRDEPERLAEVATLGEIDGGVRYVLGRGVGYEAGERRTLFARERPGERMVTGSLSSSKVSRRQLVFSRDAGGKIAVENVGRGELLVNDEVCTRAVLSPGDLVEVARRLVLLYSVDAGVDQLQASCAGLCEFPFGGADQYGIVGESRAAWELRAKIRFVARRDYHVLIVGESGTGKELVARAIHALSRRRSSPLVARNAATIPASLVDAELFGNMKGYPNPGMRERPGLIGESHQGSLFLDEIGELPHELQAHLLRVMDLGEYQRLGDARRRSADVRLIAATNRGVDELKHDLLARFTLRVETAGLDRRPEDVPLLARHLLARAVGGDSELAEEIARLGSSVDALYPSAGLVKHLVRRRYVTHVRELVGILWRSLAELRPPFLRVPVRPRRSTGAAPGIQTPSIQPPSIQPSSAVIGAETDRSPGDPPRGELEEALRASSWVLESAWRKLGLRNRHQLRRMMVRHGIKVPRTHVDPSTLTRAEIESALARCGGIKERAWRELGLRSRHQLNRLLKHDPGEGGGA